MSGTRSEDIGRGGQTAHRSLDPARTVNFLGIAVEGVTYDRMAEQIDTWIANKDGRSHHIACLNAFTVVLALSNERLARIYNGADIAGADAANPLAAILSAAMLLEHSLAAPEPAAGIRAAVAAVLEDGHRTVDLVGGAGLTPVGCAAMGDLVLQRLGKR